jgi:hypothetical protein
MGVSANKAQRAELAKYLAKIDPDNARLYMEQYVHDEEDEKAHPEKAEMLEKDKANIVTFAKANAETEKGNKKSTEEIAKGEQVKKDMAGREAKLDQIPDEQAVVNAKVEKEDLKNKVMTAAIQATNVAKASALFYGQAVVGACESFRAIAGEQLEKRKARLEKAALVGELVFGLVGALSGGVGEPLKELVGAGETAAELIKLAGETLAKQANKVGDNLDNVPNELVAHATLYSNAVTQLVIKTIKPRFDLIHDAVLAGKTLSPKQTALIEPFILQNDANMDTALQGIFGLPSSATAKKTQILIYKKLVQALTEKLIIADATDTEKMSWVGEGSPPYVYEAAKQADQAANAYAGQLQRAEANKPPAGS